MASGGYRLPATEYPYLLIKQGRRSEPGATLDHTHALSQHRTFRSAEAAWQPGDTLYQWHNGRWNIWTSAGLLRRRAPHPHSRSERIVIAKELARRRAQARNQDRLKSGKFK